MARRSGWLVAGVVLLAAHFGCGRDQGTAGAGARGCPEWSRRCGRACCPRDLQCEGRVCTDVPSGVECSSCSDIVGGEGFLYACDPEAVALKACEVYICGPLPEDERRRCFACNCVDELEACAVHLECAAYDVPPARPSFGSSGAGATETGA